MGIEEDAQNWRKVVDERVKAKTRRFVHGPRNAAPTPVANKFTNVAGAFFFPLANNIDRKLTCMKLMERDVLLLGKLVHTYGVIIQASAGLLILSSMAKCMFELFFIIRYHKDQYVIQSLLFTMSMVLVYSPPSFLLIELHAELIEFQSWLKVLCNNEPSNECRYMANQCSQMLNSIIHQIGTVK